MKYVKIQKVNHGLLLTQVNKDGSVSKRHSKTVMNRALVQYVNELDEILKRDGYENYYLKERHNIYVNNDTNPSLVTLEPVGFAYSASLMGNTGSTPTPGRAKTLYYFQLPLDGENLSKVYEVGA